jgi:hypothetical protein
MMEIAPGGIVGKPVALLLEIPDRIVAQQDQIGGLRDDGVQQQQHKFQEG